MNGFSKLSKAEKIDNLSHSLELPNLPGVLTSYWHPLQQKLFDEFSENALTNYYLPYSIAPNFLINDQTYHIPMVVEESSVVASASAGAKFWSAHGGFHAKVTTMEKRGHVHFLYSGNKQILINHWPNLKNHLYQNFKPITSNMEKRGGGVIDIKLEDCTHLLNDYFRLSATFDTADSMGANFINTVLEQMAVSLTSYFSKNLRDIATCEVIMSILSNYAPDCKVTCWVKSPVEAFDIPSTGLSASKFAEKFSTAVQIAETDIFRAVTHNKGLMNGVDAVLLATGNDFRAVEACVHAYASRDGRYSSLSSVEIQGGNFNFSIELPLTIGTIGGLTSHHPLAKQSIEILGNPSAKQLMMIIAAAGLATHFSAIKALITNGIQKGHMKLHLSNILLQLNVNDNEKSEASRWFEDKPVSFYSVSDFINNLRSHSSNE